MNKNKEIEKIISQALELQEGGKSIDEIIKLFPGYEKEIEETFLLVSDLEFKKNYLNPSVDLLTTTLQKIKESATNEKEESHVYGANEENNDRLGDSFRNVNIFLKNILKLGLSAATIVVLTLIVFVCSYFGRNGAENNNLSDGVRKEAWEQYIGQAPTPIILSGASDLDGIDEILSDINNELAQEIAMGQEYEEDFNLIFSDSELINEFGKTYDEKIL